MATGLIMPKLGMTMEQGTIVRWLKEEGQQVEKGEPILEIETDKVVMEVEAPASGTLAGISAGPDEVVPVTKVIASSWSPANSWRRWQSCPPRSPSLSRGRRLLSPRAFLRLGRGLRSRPAPADWPGSMKWT